LVLPFGENFISENFIAYLSAQYLAKKPVRETSQEFRGIKIVYQSMPDALPSLSAY
jgi:hypothetical protein